MILSLNCHGMGNPHTVHELHSFVNGRSPQAVFLMETQVDGKGLEKLREKLGFQNALGTEQVGIRDGLALL